jgi:hypothetical protein
MMSLFDEIEAAVRRKARNVAEKHLDALERGTTTHIEVNGIEWLSMSAKFDPEMRAKYIDSKENEAIRLLKVAIVDSVVLED